MRYSPDDLAVLLRYGWVGNEWHGPEPPGPNWVLVGHGPRGGKRWANRSVQESQQRTATQPGTQPPQPAAAPAAPVAQTASPQPTPAGAPPNQAPQQPPTAATVAPVLTEAIKAFQAERHADLPSHTAYEMLKAKMPGLSVEQYREIVFALYKQGIIEIGNANPSMKIPPEFRFPRGPEQEANPKLYQSGGFLRLPPAGWQSPDDMANALTPKQ